MPLYVYQRISPFATPLYTEECIDLIYANAWEVFVSSQILPKHNWPSLDRFVINSDWLPPPTSILQIREACTCTSKVQTKHSRSHFSKNRTTMPFFIQAPYIYIFILSPVAIGVPSSIPMICTSMTSYYRFDTWYNESRAPHRSYKTLITLLLFTSQWPTYYRLHTHVYSHRVHLLIYQQCGDVLYNLCCLLQVPSTQLVSWIWFVKTSIELPASAPLLPSTKQPTTTAIVES